MTMLKQQVTEEKAPLTTQTQMAEVVPSEAMVTDSSTMEEGATRAKVKARSLSPSVNEGRHYLVALLVPLVYGLALFGVELLPGDFRHSPVGGLTQAALILPWPVVLCGAIASYVRSLWLAALGGALLGIVFCAVEWGLVMLDRITPEQWTPRLGGLSANDVIIIVLSGALAGFFIAAFTQGKRQSNNR